jgi:hypothetical protein
MTASYYSSEVVDSLVALVQEWCQPVKFITGKEGQMRWSYTKASERHDRNIR